MKKMFTKFSNKLYKTQDVDFEKIDIIPSVNNNNLQIMKLCALMMMMIFGVMFILSFILDVYESNRSFYGAETIGTLMILLLSRTVLPENPKLITPFIYVFASILYCYGIYIGIISQQKNLAVTICLLLAIVPLLFIDEIIRIIAFATSAAAVTVVLVIMLKSSSDLLIYDLTDVFFSWLMGLVLSIEVNRIKIKSYVREQEITLERDTDGLTGLWNKNTLVKRISGLISSEDAKGAFFIMDIDHFKQINDKCGHSYGDKVLVETARCIRRIFGEDDIVGRFGGDEFIFYMQGADAVKASDTAERLLDYLYSNVEISTEDKGLKGSIGIAVYTYTADMSYDSLMTMADKALYITKESGRFGYTVFSENMQRQEVKAI